MSAAGRRNAIVYNFQGDCLVTPSCDTMLTYLRLLQQRFQTLTGHSSPQTEAPRQEWLPLLRSLAFAEAVQEKVEWVARQPDLPLQVAVIGPTQAGKSSVMNWLAGQSLAEASPLAGFTVHPQGFALLPTSDAFESELQSYFRGYRRVARSGLDHHQLDSFSLEYAPSGLQSHVLDGTVIWDTPDFDSAHSSHYRQAVLRVAALADVVILVVSKDKYADLSVWDFMRLLQPLQQPTVVLLNKIDPMAESTLISSVVDKWRSFRTDPPPAVVAIPYLPNPPGLVGLEAIHHSLMSTLQHAVGSVQRTRYPEQARQLCRTHWDAWSAPILSEYRLHDVWLERVDHIMDECLVRYQRDYLEHPNHYETFQRALAELLTLLEVPGLGQTLYTVRRAVTWPMRQLTALGRLASGQRETVEGGESAMLHQIAQHALVRLGESLLLEQEQDDNQQLWWRSLNQQLARQREGLLTRFDQAVQGYRVDFQPEIEKTAHGLYVHLQAHPMVLNSLRATRVTTDAAALAVALHTGGIGVHDLIIAPAMLSVTSLLTESALGRYMNKAAAQLKQRQRTAVEHLLQQTLRQPLIALPDSLNDSQRLDIPRELLEQAARQLH